MYVIGEKEVLIIFRNLVFFWNVYKNRGKCFKYIECFCLLIFSESNVEKKLNLISIFMYFNLFFFYGFICSVVLVFLLRGLLVGIKELIKVSFVFFI